MYFPFLPFYEIPNSNLAKKYDIGNRQILQIKNMISAQVYESEPEYSKKAAHHQCSSRAEIFLTLWLIIFFTFIKGVFHETFIFILCACTLYQ